MQKHKEMHLNEYAIITEKRTSNIEHNVHKNCSRSILESIQETQEKGEAAKGALPEQVKKVTFKLRKPAYIKNRANQEQFNKHYEQLAT